LDKALRKIVSKGHRLHVVDEAGPCGFVIWRHLITQDIACEVVAPSSIPKRSGNRVKADRRDALMLARLSRSGDLTAVRVPNKALAQFKHRVVELTGRSWGRARTQTVLRTVCAWRGAGPMARCALQGYRWNTGSTSWGNTFGAERHTSASASTTAWCLNWTRLDQAANPHVLLEAVALGSHEDQEPVEPPTADPHGGWCGG
jgi:hypothetical protein